MRVAELVTRAVGLINEALDIEFKPFNIVGAHTSEELDSLGFAETKERMQEMERARAHLLRSIATADARRAELADAWGALAKEPHGHMRAVLDQLVIELAHTPGALHGMRYVPAGRHIEDIGRQP